jgi:hypothetical protein
VARQVKIFKASKMLGREVAKACNIPIRFNDSTAKEQGKRRTKTIKKR